jgi:error-prone DNA polymerase
MGVRLPLLCESRIGYQKLCQLVTQFKMREKTKVEGSATWDDLQQYSSGLVCLTGGDAGRLLALNSQRHLRTTREMEALFRDIPFAIENTSELSSRLQFELNDLGYEFPRYTVPDGETMDSFLRKRVAEGLMRRYGSKNDRDLLERAKKQVEHELALIERLGFAGYFLIVWDIIQFCKRNDILIQGRGSAANSAVCYALEITAIDPVGMELLFERSLSDSRGEWPDIDLDLPSEDKREQAIEYVYQRYGELGAAMTANVISYRGKSAARKVGKALGFDQESLGRLSSLVSQWEWRGKTDTMAHSFQNAGFDIKHPRIAKYLELLYAHSGPPTASRSALRGHGHLPRSVELCGSLGACLYAGSHSRPVEQGRLR